jgi:Protein of unknown function (DUF4054)
MAAKPPYTPPTVDEFVAAYPQFDTGLEGEDAIQAALNQAGRFVDNTWLEGDYTTAYMLMTAHLLTISQNATASGGQVAGQLSSVSIGGITERYNTPAAAPASSMAATLLVSTPYGLQFKQMLKMNFPPWEVVGGIV